MRYFKVLIAKRPTLFPEGPNEILNGGGFEERLISLNIEDQVVVFKPHFHGGFSDPIRSRVMLLGGHDGPAPEVAHLAQDSLIIGGYKDFFNSPAGSRLRS
jgi:hypothetical protein